MMLTVALCALGITLGQWQTGRALEKEKIASATFARASLAPVQTHELIGASTELVFRRASLSGEFVVGWPLYLDNRPLHGVAGFYVMMPFKIAGSDRYILVARGWQPRNPNNRTLMPSLNTPVGTINLDGVLRGSIDKVMQLGQATPLVPGAIVQNITAQDVAQQTGLKMFGLVLEQTSVSVDGLLREWPLPSAGADKHRAYAFQWYALSLMAVIFFVVTGFRRGKNR
ncbi:SURF1 family protein [Undibacterium sp. Ren11W]|uniref:SURF1 family protein n=1 Tax=Undibacterium sp. Ren11W TaxID=3413045 RepID=UPI003BF13BE0